jgi:SLOG in TRPM
MMDTDSAQSGRTVPIDPNHTHFIFVDNGTRYKFGTEIKLRADLETYVSKKGLNLGGNSKFLDILISLYFIVFGCVTY